jgi:hypothetical protein
MNVLNIRCITFKAIGYIILSQRHAQADSRRPDSMSGGDNMHPFPNLL